MGNVPDYEPVTMSREPVTLFSRWRAELHEADVE
jgi:hypothetical protein